MSSSTTCAHSPMAIVTPHIETLLPELFQRLGVELTEGLAPTLLGNNNPLLDWQVPRRDELGAPISFAELLGQAQTLSAGAARTMRHYNIGLSYNPTRHDAFEARCELFGKVLRRVWFGAVRPLALCSKVPSPPSFLRCHSLLGSFPAVCAVVLCLAT